MIFGKKKKRMFSPLAEQTMLCIKKSLSILQEKNGDAHWVQIRFAVKVAKDVNSFSYQMPPNILMNRMGVVCWVNIAVYVFLLTALLKATYER